MVFLLVWKWCNCHNERECVLYRHTGKIYKWGDVSGIFNAVSLGTYLWIIYRENEKVHIYTEIWPIYS